MYYQFIIYQGYIAGMINQYSIEITGVGFYILLGIIVLSLIVSGITLTKGLKGIIKKHYFKIRSNC